MIPITIAKQIAHHPWPKVRITSHPHPPDIPIIVLFLLGRSPILINITLSPSSQQCYLQELRTEADLEMIGNKNAKEVNF